ncbi:MAG: HIT domain-containing protein [Candidatus Omnitrophota bacterium]
MDKLWAPWRVTYLQKLNRKTKGCVFCRIHRSKQDKKNYIILRSQHAFAVLNIYPYNNGHVLIVANRHVGELAKLSRDEKLDLLSLAEKTKALLDKAIQPAGYNIGMNLGRVAGAGFPGHLHIHIVPRWSGDINFMPVIAQTKVISQSLNELWKCLTQYANAKK